MPRFANSWKSSTRRTRALEIFRGAGVPPAIFLSFAPRKNRRRDAGVTKPFARGTIIVPARCDLKRAIAVTAQAELFSAGFAKGDGRGGELTTD
jgi:hypothetical protein